MNSGIDEKVNRIKRLCFNPNRPVEGYGAMSQHPFADKVSAPRQTMFLAQHNAAITPEYPSQSPVRSGQEWNLTETTHRIVVRKTCYVVDRIDETPFQGQRPTEVKLVVREMDGVFHLYQFGRNSTRQGDFSFEWNIPHPNMLERGKLLEQGFVIAQTYGVQPDGGWTPGFAVRLAYADHPLAGEDTYLITESAAEAAAFEMNQIETFGLGGNKLPKNTYGDSVNFRLFPNIGEKVRNDGVIYATFDYKPELAAAQLSNKALKKLDYLTDNYAVCQGVLGTVTSIKVVVNDWSAVNLSAQMMEQLLPYIEANRRSREAFLRLYNNLEGAENLSGEMHRQVLMDLIQQEAAGTPQRRSALKLNRKQKPLEPITVTITVTKRVVPNNGFKFADYVSTKGVSSVVLPDNRLPGMQAIADSASGTKRMNNVRYENLFYNDLCDRLTQELLQLVGVKQLVRSTTKAKALTAQFQASPKYKVFVERMLYLYENISPPLYYWLVDDPEKTMKHIENSLIQGLVYLHPPGIEIDTVKAVSNLTAYFDCSAQHDTYLNDAGEITQTHTPIRHAPMDMLVLDKVPFKHGSAGATYYRTVQGFPGSTPSGRKDSFALAHGLTRSGEGETAVMVHAGGNAGGIRAVAEEMAMSDEETLRVMIEAWLSSDKPTAIYRLVDRNKVPYNTAALNVIKHDLLVGGIGIGYYHPDHGLIE